MSALKGDNVVTRSAHTPYYTDKPLLELLEDSPAAEIDTGFEARLPVQYVVRPNLNFRGFQGTLTSGKLRVGDEIKVLPSGKTSNKAIISFIASFFFFNSIYSLCFCIEIILSIPLCFSKSL